VLGSPPARTDRQILMFRGIGGLTVGLPPRSTCAQVSARCSEDGSRTSRTRGIVSSHFGCSSVTLGCTRRILQTSAWELLGVPSSELSRRTPHIEVQDSIIEKGFTLRDESSATVEIDDLDLCI
jgi:hypothetical protein